MSRNNVILYDWELRGMQINSKSQFCRPIQPQPDDSNWHHGFGYKFGHDPYGPYVMSCDIDFPRLNRFPYGRVGSILYVREAWRPYKLTMKMQGNVGVVYKIGYLPSPYPSSDWAKADGRAEKYWGESHPYANDYLRWRPAVCMPAWAARFKLLITDIRIQRILDITEEEAIKEGVNHGEFEMPAGYMTLYARSEFLSYWDQRYTDKNLGTDANPWVWAASFQIMKDDKMSGHV